MDVTSFPQLKSPPIHEAVLDVRVRARPGAGTGDFSSLPKALGHIFPTAEVMHSLEARIEFTPGGTSRARTSALNQVGLLFKSADGSFILQSRIDGMTLSRLKPYNGFDEFFKVFVKCWDVYLKALQPTGATRLAMRYINRFDVPSSGELAAYLTKVPDSPVDDAQFTAFFHRDHYRFADSKFSSNVSTALEPSIDGTSSTIMIDVDVFREGLLGAESQELMSIFSQLRTLKNRVFFSLLAPAALERFE